MLEQHLKSDVDVRRHRSMAVHQCDHSRRDVCLSCVTGRGSFATQGPREVRFQTLLRSSALCLAEVMEAEDSLFILYTSGTTGKPKGVVHVHGGFMVGTTYHLRNFIRCRGERRVLVYV